MVEDESHAQELEKSTDEENRIRRVAGLENAKAGARINLEGQKQLDSQCPGVFDKIAKGSGPLPDFMPVDIDPFQRLAGAHESRSFGADDGNAVSRFGEGTRLLPHAPVLGNRQILDDDTDTHRFCGHVS